MEQSVANLVDMRDVSFTRGNRCIFDNISLTVPRGKITAIMATVILRMLNWWRKLKTQRCFLIFPRGVVIMKLNISMPLAVRVRSGINGITGKIKNPLRLSENLQRTGEYT